MTKPLISIVVPVFNEEKNIPALYGALVHEWYECERPTWLHRVVRLCDGYDFEVVFVDDGSSDGSVEAIKKLATAYDNVRFVEFSRNFGKEIATTAGVHASSGDAVIMMDADLQHPVEILSQFISKWREGFEVVIGVRLQSKSDSLIKKWGGKVFYKLIRLISDVPVIPQATDYRLLDRQVVDAFNELPERSRITRGLIDWLGFKRGVIYFEADERASGEASYSTFKLVKLAVTSVISLSLFPLRFAGYLGLFITFVSLPMGVVMLLDRYSSLGYEFTGSAILANIVLFMVGIILVCIGLLSFYIEQIYHESQGRPMYVVRSRK